MRWSSLSALIRVAPVEIEIGIEMEDMMKEAASVVEEAVVAATDIT